MRHLILPRLMLLMIITSSCRPMQGASDLANMQLVSENQIYLALSPVDDEGASRIFVSDLQNTYKDQVDELRFCFSNEKNCQGVETYRLDDTEGAEYALYTSKERFQIKSGHVIQLVSSSRGNILSVKIKNKSVDKSKKSVPKIAPIQPNNNIDKGNNKENNDDPLVPNPNNVQISDFEWEVIRLTNQARASRGLSALEVQEKIMITSRRSSVLMKQRGRLQHGLTSGWRRENIAMGYRTPQKVVRGWLNSPGHYRNIMASRIKYIGVGDTSDKSGSLYWTQQFN